MNLSIKMDLIVVSRSVIGNVLNVLWSCEGKQEGPIYITSVLRLSTSIMMIVELGVYSLVMILSKNLYFSPLRKVKQSNIAKCLFCLKNKLFTSICCRSNQLKFHLYIV